MLPSTLDDVGIAQLSTILGSVHKKVVCFMDQRLIFNFFLLTCDC